MYSRSLFSVKSIYLSRPHILASAVQGFLTTAQNTNNFEASHLRKTRKRNDKQNNKIHLRLAREDDFQNVLKLSEGIYSGMDYIPVVFHDWLKTQNKLFFMAELQGKVIGLNVANIVSDGRAFFTRGLRIHPEYQGQGLSYQIILGVINYVRQIYPQVSKKHYIAFQGTMEIFKIAKRLGDKIVMELNYHYFQVNFVQELPKWCKTLGESGLDLHPYDKHDAEGILTRKTALDFIAPQKLMIRKMGPYDALPSNMKYIFQENDKMFADVSTQELNEGKIPRSFSHGCVSLRVSCVLWVCTVYANDLESFRAHVLMQLKSASEMIGNDFVLMVVHSTHSKNSSVDERKVLEELFHRQQISTTKSDSFLLYERILESQTGITNWKHHKQ